MTLKVALVESSVVPAEVQRFASSKDTLELKLIFSQKERPQVMDWLVRHRKRSVVVAFPDEGRAVEFVKHKKDFILIIDSSTDTHDLIQQMSTVVVTTFKKLPSVLEHLSTLMIEAVHIDEDDFDLEIDVRHRPTHVYRYSSDPRVDKSYYYKMMWRLNRNICPLCWSKRIHYFPTVKCRDCGYPSGWVTLKYYRLYAPFYCIHRLFRIHNRYAFVYYPFPGYKHTEKVNMMETEIDNEL